MHASRRHLLGATILGLAASRHATAQQAAYPGGRTITIVVS